VQADILSPPVRPASFDLVFCIGVIQHTPDPHRAFLSLANCVRPGGMLGVWIYERARWEIIKPKHALRRITRTMSPERAMRFVEHYAPRALRIRRGLKRFPGGSVLSRLVPVADLEDYAGNPLSQLTAQQELEWTIMDTHDMLITWHEQAQTAGAVARWFSEAGFVDVHRSDAEGIAMVGRAS
jgi:SAM-dependent methyltransferase